MRLPHTVEPGGCFLGSAPPGINMSEADSPTRTMKD